MRKIALSIISSMAVLPKRFLVKLDSNNDYFKTYQHPLGVLRLTIESGQNFGEEKKTRNILKKLVHDVPDCFVKVIVSPQDQWQTSTIKNDRHPEWNETHDFLVSDIEQVIELDVKDDDTVSDDNLGVGSTTVKQLLLDGGKQEINLNHEDQPTDAKVTLSGQFFRFVPDATSFSEQGSGICGLLTVLVASAFGIKGRRQELKPSVKVSWGEQVFRTAIKSDAPGSDIENPSFDQAFNVEIKAGMVPGPPVRIALMDKEEEIGAVEVGLGDVLAASDLALQQDFDIAQGTTVRAGIWLRGIRQA